MSIELHYRETIPSPSLQPYIKCYWLLSGDCEIENDFEKIIPDGSPELIIHLGLPFEEKINGVVRRQETAFLYGQLSSSIEIKPSNQPKVAGIKFHPYGLVAFTDIPQHELAGRHHAISDLFPRRKFENFHEIIQNAECDGGLFAVIDRMMLSLMKEHKKFDAVKMDKIRLAISKMSAVKGSLKIDELTCTLNMSRRELERKFNQYVGISPKQFARILRLQFALQSKPKSELLTHLALDAGYYDQAHFIREFTSIINEKPSAFFALEKELTDKFLLK